MLRRGFLVLSLGFLFVMSPFLLPQARAADAGARAVELPEVLISPRRVPGLSVDANAYPGHATVITRRMIERSSAATIQELLARQDGVQFNDQQGFGLGADAGINLRGLVNPSRMNILVLVDGVRQNRLTGDETGVVPTRTALTDRGASCHRGRSAHAGSSTRRAGCDPTPG